MIAAWVRRILLILSVSAAGLTHLGVASQDASQKAGSAPAAGAAPGGAAKAAGAEPQESSGKESSKQRRKRERERERERAQESGAATTASVAAPVVREDVLAAPSPDRRVTTLTLKQMGAWSSLRLRGVDGSRVLGFNLRPNEYVVSAKLHVSYDYSPALLEDLSHFNIFVNERVAASEPLPRGKGVGNRRSIDINPRLFKDINEIRFNLIGHYTRQCENPNHSSLWLQVSDVTTLDLVIGSKPVEPDLKTLPDPFLDARESDGAQLNVVLPSEPSADVVRAAGIVASWFGMHAGARGVKFAVSSNQLPSGNAIVLISGQKPTAGYTGVAASSLAMQRHPNDPSSTVLLVNGGSDAELLRAARALATSGLALVGPTVNITKETESAPRKPYDAPAWVRSDRAMKLGELAKVESLRVKSYYPEAIRVNYRVSPDVFAWRTDGAPLSLKYRATRLPTHRNSNLEVGVNGKFVDSIALNDNPNVTPTASVTSQVNKSVSNSSLFLPPYALGGRDQLQLTFAFDVQLQGECENLPTDNLVASIDPESTLDFSKFPKFAALPNLQYFAQIGYPFTRLADLSETTVVLPERAGASELSLYLTLMGKLGESVGFPALKHQVVLAKDIEKHADRDLIVIGTAQNQPLMTSWDKRLPMVIENGTRRLREPHVSWRPQFRWEQIDIDPLEPKQGEINLSGLTGLVNVMAFESPLRDRRSVVFFYADKEADHMRHASAIINPERIPNYRGDFVVVQEAGLVHSRISPTYHVGEIPLLTKLRWFLADNPLLVAATAALLAIMVAIILYRPLRFLVDFQRSRRPFAFLRRRTPPEA